MPLTGIVVVTGGAGFIGSHIAAALSNSGARVRVLDDLSTGFADVPAVSRLYLSSADSGASKRNRIGSSLTIVVSTVIALFAP